MQASVTVAYVNEPKSGKGPGNIKDTTGRYYKVWKSSRAPGSATLGEFKANGTYEIEYHEEQYEGKTQYYADKIVSASTTTNGTNGNGHDASAMYREQPTGQRHISEWLACLKVAGLVYAGAGEASVDKMMATARFIYNEPISIVDEAKRLFNATEASE